MEEGVKRFLEHMRLQTPPLTQVLKRFKLLIVDEFQDLDDSQFEFIKHFKTINPSLRIVGIGDLAQNIYRFRGTSNEFLRNRIFETDPDMETFELTTNFRSTPAILNFVNAVFSEEIKEGHILPMSPEKRKAYGMKPQIYEYAKNPSKGTGEFEDLVVETILPLIKKAKDSQKSVALIFPVLKCISYQYITALIYEKSKSLGFTPDFHQITKEDETCTTQEFTYDPSSTLAPVQKSTIHSSKGLEWDFVAIINITDSMYDLRDNEEDSEAFVAEKTNLLYVGLTRAAEELYIFGDANIGGRHRLFARMGDELGTFADIHLWGTEQKDYEKGRAKPIGVKELIRKLPQHKDLYERIKELTENIKTQSNEGVPIVLEDIYTEMKKRNREISFGTFIDWKRNKIALSVSCKSIFLLYIFS
jgi:superfamily I DNA/RNA helicase